MKIKPKNTTTQAENHEIPPPLILPNRDSTDSHHSNNSLPRSVSISSAQSSSDYDETEPNPSVEAQFLSPLSSSFSGSSRSQNTSPTSPRFIEMEVPVKLFRQGGGVVDRSPSAEKKIVAPWRKRRAKVPVSDSGMGSEASISSGWKDAESALEM